MARRSATRAGSSSTSSSGARIDHRLPSGAAIGRGEGVRQLLERDRRAAEGAPQGLVGRERRERLVDLLGGMVERTAQLELLVVERTRLEADLGSRRAPADEHDD